MPEVASVNGRLSRPEEATVSINDRGFLFADGVYEAFHVHNGRMWCADEHYARLANSLAAIDLQADVEQVRAWVEAAVAESRLIEALVYLQVTRGVAPRSHVPPPGIQPTVIVVVRELVPVPAELRRQGVRVITVPETRWARRDIKSTNLLPNVLAKQQAAAAGAHEAIFVERDGSVNEGASTNLFLVDGQQVVTPPLGPSILPGVTRNHVVELARRLGFEMIERRVEREELDRAHELFLVGTTTEVLGIVEVDGQSVAGGRVGHVTQRLYEAYQADVQAAVGSTS